LSESRNLLLFPRMSLADLIPALHDLPRADKFRALQFLTTELARQEGDMLVEGLAYPVFSPLDAFSAAATLESCLKEQTG
jgi:hypothetical protein